jgi:hypothetical protein
MDHVKAEEYDKNPALAEIVEPDTDLKNILVEYVGEKLSPEDFNVTVEMIIEVVAKEFPEFVLAVAEENWVRGYQQALDDVETGREMVEEAEKNVKQRKNCKLCEEK